MDFGVFDTEKPRFVIKNDLAMITLNRKINFSDPTVSDKISCVCDPEPHERLDLAKCKALGWGRTQPLDPESVSSVLLSIDLPGKFKLPPIFVILSIFIFHSLARFLLQEFSDS